MWIIPELSLHEGNGHNMAHLHSQTEVNLIIAALLIGSWGIICTCKYLDDKEARLAREKAAAQK